MFGGMDMFWRILSTGCLICDFEWFWWFEFGYGYSKGADPLFFWCFVSRIVCKLIRFWKIVDLQSREFVNFGGLKIQVFSGPPTVAWISALAVIGLMLAALLCLCRRNNCNLRLSLSGDTSGNTLVSSQTNMEKNTKGMERCSATWRN